MASGSLPMVQKVSGSWNSSRLLRWITRGNHALPTRGKSLYPKAIHLASVSGCELSNRDHSKRSRYTRLIKGWLSTSSVTRQVQLDYATETKPAGSEPQYHQQPKRSVSACFIRGHTGLSFTTISRPSTPGEISGYDGADEIPDLSSLVSVPDRLPVFNGNYSNVYKGVFQGQVVAVKALRTVNENHAMLRKLRREICTWWNLHHDNIVPCLGFIEVEELGEFGAMISPWYENGSAFSYLSQNPSPLRRVQILLGVATGLLYLHNLDPTIVHGDLKPGNILIDEDYNARLCDFGLVRLIPRDGKHTDMTTTSGHTGTARYLAFELVERDLPPTTASDVHALACVGMQLLYSQPPYAHIQNQVCNAGFKIFKEIGSGVPPARRPKGLNGVMSEFWDLLESCWNMRPQRRPLTDEVVEFLEHRGHDIAEYYDITQTPGFGAE